MAILNELFTHAGTLGSDSLVLAFQGAADLKNAGIWQPPAASTTAGELDAVWDFINYLCYFFFAVVVIAMIVFVIKYKHRRGTPYRTDYPHHNTPLELAWSILPTFIVIGLFWVGFKDYLNVRTPPKNCYDIQVTAQKWQWTFTYPNGAQSTNQMLYVPLGKPVRLIMRSNDVLHALFIPDFRVKQDIVPGRYTYLWFQCDIPTGLPAEALVKENADKARYMSDAHNGFNLFCAEYCGQQHSMMYAKVFVLGPEDFDAWLKKEAEWLDRVPDDQLVEVAGPILYARCAQCHSLDGSPVIGPTWKGLYERVSKYPVVGPGKQYPTPEAYIRASILNPGEYIAPPLDGHTFTNSMPTFKGQLSERAVDALEGMMRHLEYFDSKGKRLSTPAAAPAATSGSKP